MNIAAVLVTGCLALSVAGSGVAPLVRHPKIVDTVAAVGFPVQHVWMLGVVKLAAAGGLACGPLWWPVSVAAALGLVVYFVAAIGTHLRARRRDVAAPAVFLALSVSSLVLLAGVGS
ncbi:DoxX family protein [Nocardia abscessus]|uniref:DoxX family protein n=1 Tax=Nocardia abscessus TaxID=120957 RepID=UPI0018945D34|nr:DoxX family protein [Nocardia abscessus]MBF6339361.1 DoxX family protein [Nocardia abscessus]